MTDEIITVVISDPGTVDATIILPSQTTPTQKRYKYAFYGMTFSAGDRAYALKVSGTYILLGGAVSGSGGGLPPGDIGDAVWSPLLYRGADGGLCEIDEL